jgi:hypothetical protein
VDEAPPDLLQLIQRRELQAQEQKMARAAYAYGPDLRRSHLFDETALGEALLRGVDRRWPELIAELAADTLDPVGATPTELLAEIAACGALLRAHVPAVRTIAPRAREREPWPLVTPLGTTRGAVSWLLVDGSSVRALPAAIRRFVLSSALAHLQCEHGPLFSAHLMAHRGGRLVSRALPPLLAPWSRVAAFSADRAGLLACVELDVARAGLAAERRDVSWWPRFPDAEVRLAALADFDRSAVMRRVRRLAATAASHATGATTGDTAGDTAGDTTGATTGGPPPTAATERPWSLARCDERLTRKLGLL